MCTAWVPFAKNTTHPHPHHPPNDEIRLINTSVPKIKSWNCSITFFSSQTQNKVFKIVWGEFLEKRELIHEKYCAWDHLRGTCAPSPPTPTTPAQIKGTNRHQISGLQLSLGNHWTNCPSPSLHTRSLNIVLIFFTYIICPWQHQKLSIWSNDHHKHILRR